MDDVTAKTAAAARALKGHAGKEEDLSEAKKDLTGDREQGQGGARRGTKVAIVEEEKVEKQKQKQKKDKDKMVKNNGKEFQMVQVNQPEKVEFKETMKEQTIVKQNQHPLPHSGHDRRWHKEEEDRGVNEHFRRATVARDEDRDN
ncbi:hypothetical protein IAR55_000516 [Kwoniella newhampshirensis]|uniref:Cytoplasmic protein n=1 Tax=Kwoniella newhampshirensis TaxID=1651941 RepID=A0AAW0Z738_9TREE